MPQRDEIFKQKVNDCVQHIILQKFTNFHGIRFSEYLQLDRMALWPRFFAPPCIICQHFLFSFWEKNNSLHDLNFRQLVQATRIYLKPSCDVWINKNLAIANRSRVSCINTNIYTHSGAQPRLKSWGDQGLGLNAPRPARGRDGGECGRGSLPPAVRVRGYHHPESFWKLRC